MGESVMIKEESEDKFLALTQQINQLEWLEEDLLSMKRQHEQAVSELQADCRHLSFALESLLNHMPEDYAGKYAEQEANDHLLRQMDRYVDEHLDHVSTYTMGVRRQLERDKEELIGERSRLRWE